MKHWQGRTLRKTIWYVFHLKKKILYVSLNIEGPTCQNLQVLRCKYKSFHILLSLFFRFPLLSRPSLPAFHLPKVKWYELQVRLEVKPISNSPECSDLWGRCVWLGGGRVWCGPPRSGTRPAGRRATCTDTSRRSEHSSYQGSCSKGQDKFRARHLKLYWIKEIRIVSSYLPQYYQSPPTGLNLSLKNCPL